MKNLLLFGLLVFTFNSFGQTKSDACRCMEMTLDMAHEIKDSGSNERKMKQIQKSYRSEIEACSRLGEEMAREMAGMSNKEKERAVKRMEEDLKHCDAYKELQRFMQQDQNR